MMEQAMHIGSIWEISVPYPQFCCGFPGGLAVKNLPVNVGTAGFDPWVLKIPWRKKWQPTPDFLPGIVHGQRNCGLQSMGLERVGHNLATRNNNKITLKKKVFLKIGGRVQMAVSCPQRSCLVETER